MATLSYMDEIFEIDHAVKGDDYIHGYDANGVLLVAFEEVSDFSGFTFTAEYMLPENCLEEKCNDVRYVAKKLVTRSGTEISTGSEGIRRNLLDNWYFANPVNQRGFNTGNECIVRNGTIIGHDQATYDDYRFALEEETGVGYLEGKILNKTWSECYSRAVSGKTYVCKTTSVVPGVMVGTSYCIDRWVGLTTDTLVALNTGCMVVTGQICQKIPLSFDSVSGRKLTLSILTIDGELYSVTATVPTTKPSSYSTLADTDQLRIAWDLTNFRAQIKNVSVVAAKLELGEGQTLAHQEADDSWVLNEIPDYAEELAKCQRYFVRIKNEGTATGFIGTGVATSGNGTVCVLPLPVSMRAASVLTGYSGIKYGDSGSDLSAEATSIEAIATASPYNTRPIMIRGSSTRGDAYAVFLSVGGYLDFDANL